MIDNTPSEVELLQASVKGDTTAFETIVKKYQSLVCAITYGATVDLEKSEELAHEAFIKAWTNLAQLRDLTKFRAWLCSIAQNIIRNYFRHEQRDIVSQATSLDKMGDISSESFKPVETIINKEQQAVIRQALEQIPEKYRAPLVLFYRQERSINQVAEQLELSVEAAKTRVSRGRKLLKKQVAVMVETTISRTGPSKAFTTAVIASITGMVIKGSGVAAAAGVVAAATKTGTTAGVVTLMSGVTAKIITAAAVVAIGVGAVVTYKQITKPDKGPDSFETASAVYQEKEEHNELAEKAVEKSKGETANLLALGETKGRLESNRSINISQQRGSTEEAQFAFEPKGVPSGFISQVGERGVGFSAWFDKLVWKSNETPIFKADLSHRGKSKLQILGSYKLECDGSAYFATEDNENDWPNVYLRDADYRDIVFVLDNRWVDEQSKEALKLTSGSHRIRISFKATVLGESKERIVKIISDTAEFKILEPGKNITEEEMLKIAVGGWPGEKYTEEKVAVIHFKKYGQKLTYNELAKFYCDEAQKDKDADLVECALAFEQDDTDRLRLYIILGGAYHGQLLKYSDVLWGRQRKITARAYFVGLSEALELDLPIKRPERTKVFKYYEDNQEIPIGHLPAIAISVARDADRVRGIVEQRQILTGQIIQMYAREPDAFEELRELAIEYIGGKETAEQLVNAVKSYKKNRSNPFEVLSINNKQEINEVEFVNTFKVYDVNGIKIEAGFVPDKREIILREPVFLTFYVKNIGERSYQFSVGGDNRGSVRHNNFRITAANENGEVVKDPYSYDNFGGFGNNINLEFGDIYAERLYLGHWCAFEKPGVYTVTCKRTLNEHEDTAEYPEIPVTISFKLNILPYDAEKIGDFIAELGDQIRLGGEGVMREASLAFSAINDEAIIPYLISIMKSGADWRSKNFAIDGLKHFSTKESIEGLIFGLKDNDHVVRDHAASVLANIDKKDYVIEVLFKELENADASVKALVVRALGETPSGGVFESLKACLEDKDAKVRYAAAEALGSLGKKEAVTALKPYLEDEDMAMRIAVVKGLQGLGEPIDAQWLVPVILSRRNARSLGHAPRLLRLYAGGKAVPVLLNCLDFKDPSVRDYYNYAIIDAQGSCRGGLKIPWVSDLNRDGKPEEIEKNRDTLKRIEAWVEHYYEYRMDEKLGPKYPDWWGGPVDGISIRVRVNQRVWPEGMPQLIMIDVKSHLGEGSIHLSSVPEPLEVEINRVWYARQPELKEATMGIDAGHGSSFHNILLNEKWRRISDDQPLQLSPGKYTLRVGLSTTPENQRTGLAISKPIQFKVIEVD